MSEILNIIFQRYKQSIIILLSGGHCGLKKGLIYESHESASVWIKALYVYNRIRQLLNLSLNILAQKEFKLSLAFVSPPWLVVEHMKRKPP